MNNDYVDAVNALLARELLRRRGHRVDTRLVRPEQDGLDAGRVIRGDGGRDRASGPDVVHAGRGHLAIARGLDDLRVPRASGFGAPQRRRPALHDVQP